MAQISDPTAPHRLRATYLRFLRSRRRPIPKDGRATVAPLATPALKPARGRRPFNGRTRVLGRMQSLLNLSYEELKRRRDEPPAGANRAGRLSHEAIEWERDSALKEVRELAGQNARLREALERISQSPHNNYEAHRVARAALAEADGADVPYPTN